MDNNASRKYAYTPDSTIKPNIPKHEIRLKELSDELCSEVSRRVEAYEPGITHLRNICVDLWKIYPNSTVTFIRQISEGMLYQKIKFGISKKNRGRTLRQTADLCEILEIPPEHPNLRDFQTEVDTRYPGQFVYPQQNL